MLAVAILSAGGSSIWLGPKMFAAVWRHPVRGGQWLIAGRQQRRRGAQPLVVAGLVRQVGKQAARVAPSLRRRAAFKESII
jgi:hypothetical protein